MTALMSAVYRGDAANPPACRREGQAKRFLTEQAIHLGPLNGRDPRRDVADGAHWRCDPRTPAGSLRWAERQVIRMGEQTPKGRLFARRRRANVEGGRQHEHKVRVSPEEEGMLVRLAEAQHVTVPRLLVESALSSGTETPTERRQAMTELFALHRLLAAVSNNVNQIARATNATGQAQAETSVTLVKVREVAERIDAAIDGLSLP